MSMARHRVAGELPEHVYIVTDGNTHRLYSKLSAARGVRTRENKYSYRHSNPMKIYQLKVADLVEEVE